MTPFQKIGLYPPIGTTNNSGLHTVLFSLNAAIHSTISRRLINTFVSAHLHSPGSKQRTFLNHMPVSLSTLPNRNAWMCPRLVDQQYPMILQFIWFQEHVIYAQDTLKRDVVIKITRTNSDEARIHDLILCQPQLFKGVLPTIEIIRSPHAFSFVVTPRCVGIFLLSHMNLSELDLQLGLSCPFTRFQQCATFFIFHRIVARSIFSPPCSG
jgi:hypothetical protein